MAFAGGDGSSGNPFQIENSTQLAEIATIVGDGYYFILNNDIDLAGATWVSIGSITNPFKGYFDGQGFEISNFVITQTSSTRLAGLFSNVSTGEITDLNLADVTISFGSIAGTSGALVGSVTGAFSVTDCHVDGVTMASSKATSRVGGMVGSNTAGSFTDCSVSNVNFLTGDRIGGFAGEVNSGTFLRCHTSGGTIVNNGGTTTFGACSGGFIGLAYGGVYSQCSSDIDVSGTMRFCGGFAGLATTLAASGFITFTNCYARGTSLSGSVYSGGFTGYTYSTGLNDIEFTNCYSTGAVSAAVSATSDQYGGFTGYTSRVVITNCFYDQDTSGQSNDDGRGTPETTANMQTESTFTGVSWDFTGVWEMEEPAPGYPIFITTVTQYTVTVEADPVSGGTVSVNGSSSVTADLGTPLSFSELANTDYTFVEWQKDGITTSLPSVISESATYVAIYSYEAPPPALHPVALIRWMDNNSGRWSAYREVSLGKTGDTFLVKRLFKLGTYRTRQYEIVLSDAADFQITAIEEDVRIKDQQ